MSVTLAPDLAQMVRRKLASGSHASAQDLIREGLEALEAEDAAIGNWLRYDVAPTLDAHDADASRLLSVEEVERNLRAHVDAWKKPHGGA